MDGTGWAGSPSLSQQRSLASWEGVEAPPAHRPLVPRLSWTWSGQVKDLCDGRARASDHERRVHRAHVERGTENEDSVSGGRSEATGWWRPQLVAPRKNPWPPRAVWAGGGERPSDRGSVAEWRQVCGLRRGQAQPCPGGPHGVDAQRAEQPGLDRQVRTRGTRGEPRCAARAGASRGPVLR